jgi:hypothetical protein
VLTGDIIKSTELASAKLEDVRRRIAQTVEDFGRARPGAVVGKPDFFRGDAWQVLLCEPGAALRLAILICARLRAKDDVNTRVSLGIGAVEHVFEERISMSTGEAFVLSGRALDGMSAYADLACALPKRAGVLSQWLPVVMLLCSGIVRSWTRRQAELVAVGLSLDNPTQEQIANSLERKVTKQTVQESLASAGWRSLLEMTSVFEQTDWEVLTKHDDS